MANSPISTTINLNSTRNRVSFASIGLDPDPPGMPDTEQMVHGLEPLLAFGVVCTADIHAGLELALGVVAEEGEDGWDGGGCDVERQLVLTD